MLRFAINMRRLSVLVVARSFWRITLFGAADQLLCFIQLTDRSSRLFRTELNAAFDWILHLVPIGGAHETHSARFTHRERL
jgi:hypothetical protein